MFTYKEVSDGMVFTIKKELKPWIRETLAVISTAIVMVEIILLAVLLSV
jgi:hypothetical protein